MTVKLWSAVARGRAFEAGAALGTPHLSHGVPALWLGTGHVVWTVHSGGDAFAAL